MFPLPEHVLHLRGTHRQYHSDSDGVLGTSRGSTPKSCLIYVDCGGHGLLPSAHHLGLLLVAVPQFPFGDHPSPTQSPEFMGLSPPLLCQLGTSAWPVSLLSPWPPWLIQRWAHDPGECNETCPITFVGTFRKGIPFSTEITKLGDGLPENKANTKESRVRNGNRFFRTLFKHLDPAVPSAGWNILLNTEIYS